VIEFIYDGQGRRVAEKVDNVLTKQWVWCGTEMCEERDDDGAVVKRFYAQGVQVPASSSPANKLFYGRDHLGSVRELVDDDETVRGRWDYDPYGKRSVNGISSGALEVDMTYTGHYYHGLSGLHLTLYRAYDPNEGRWLNRDPIQESAGVNIYGYVKNNSINKIDPLGDIDISLDYCNCEPHSDQIIHSWLNLIRRLTRAQATGMVPAEFTGLVECLLGKEEKLLVTCGWSFSCDVLTKVADGVQTGKGFHICNRFWKKDRTIVWKRFSGLRQLNIHAAY
jgi:RHS repeat-associated protein